MSLTISIIALHPLIQLLKYVIKIIWNMLESSIYSNKEEKIFELLIHYFCSFDAFHVCISDRPHCITRKRWDHH